MLCPRAGRSQLPETEAATRQRKVQEQRFTSSNESRHYTRTEGRIARNRSAFWVWRVVSNFLSSPGLARVLSPPPGPPPRRGRIVRPPPPRRGLRIGRESGCVSPSPRGERAGVRGRRGRAQRRAQRLRSA